MSNGLSLFISMVATLLPGPIDAAPPQPTSLAAFHHSGQTFITWTERADVNREHYRIYRHTQPISAGNLVSATLVYTVSEGSSQFYADRYNVDSDVWQARYLERFVIRDDGSPLAAGTGLLVWTLAPADFSGATSGNGYYAVTTVDASGAENRSDFGPANATSTPLPESVNDPLPVHLTAGAGGLGHVFVQYMNLREWNPTFHAPRTGNGYYGLSSATQNVTDSVQYAYTYAVGEPDPANCGGSVPAGRLPLILLLHGWGGNSYPPDIGPTEYYCTYEIRPTDIGETWFYGFARQHDFRQGGAVEAGDAVVNYTEQRILRMIYDVLRHPTLGPRIDRSRIYVFGESMGGSGALAFALRYPNVFAAAYASQGMTNYRTSGDGGGTDWRTDVAPKWGDPSLNLPVVNLGPGQWADPLRRYDGTGVWDWQNHQANLTSRVGDDMAPLGVAHGFGDAVIEWPTQGRPAYAAFNASRQAWGGYINGSGHSWMSFAGLPPTLGQAPDLSPFFGFQVALTESVPGLSNASGNSPLPPITSTAVSTYNLALDWSASWNAWDGAPVDAPGQWRISLHTLDGSSQTVDVTPRRLQSFRVISHTQYVWENRRATDNALVMTGTAVAGGDGLVTVVGFTVTASGNRLVVRPGLPVVLTPRAYLPLVLRDAGGPAPERQFPDTTGRIVVFNDQLDLRGATDAQVRFAATHYAGSQKQTLGETRSLRAHNPNFLVLHYRLGQALGHSMPDGACQPTTNYLSIVSGTNWVREWPGDAAVQETWFYHWSGSRVFNCTDGHYLMNLGDAGWRVWWSTQVISQLIVNENDGLFADSYNVPNYGFVWNPVLPVIDTAFEAQWAARERAFTDDIRSRFAGRWKWIPNIGSFVTTRDPSNYSNVDGVMIEDFAEWSHADYFDLGDWQLQMNRVLPLAVAGKIILAQTYPNTDDVNERMFVLGSYLLAKGSRGYINLDIGQDPEWFPEYGIDLGAPIDPLPVDIDALLHPTWNVYARRYAKGIVLVNPTTESRAISLGATLYRVTPSGGGIVPADGTAPGALSYAPVTSVTLASHQAAVLLGAMP